MRTIRSTTLASLSRLHSRRDFLIGTAAAGPALGTGTATQARALWSSLLVEAQEDLLRRAELLHLHGPEPKRTKLLTLERKIGGPLGAHLNQDSTPILSPGS